MTLDRAEVYLDAYARMGHVALGIGDRDLALGVSALKALAAKSKVPFVNANIVDAVSGEPVFKERLLLERAGVKIGMFGVVTPAFPGRERLQEKEGVRIEDPAVVAKAQVEALRAEGARVIVALAHLSLEECKAIGVQVPGITVFLGTNSQQMLRYPERAGDSFIVDAFSKGKYLSVLSLLVKEGGTGELRFVDPNRRANLVREVESTKMRVDSRKRAIEQAKGAATGEGGDGGDVASRARNVEWLEKSLAELEQELSAKQAELDALPEGAPEGENYVAYDFPAMSKTLADDPEILAKTEALKEKYPALKVPGH